MAAKQMKPIEKTSRARLYSISFIILLGIGLIIAQIGTVISFGGNYLGLDVIIFSVLGVLLIVLGYFSLRSRHAKRILYWTMGVLSSVSVLFVVSFAYILQFGASDDVFPLEGLLPFLPSFLCIGLFIWLLFDLRENSKLKKTTNPDGFELLLRLLFFASATITFIYFVRYFLHGISGS